MMKEKDIVFVNGEFLRSTEATISVFDRGFLFGDGVYEVLPIVEGKIIDREEFWERFKRSLKAISLEIPYKEDEFEELINHLLVKNSLQEGGVYIQITRGIASREFAFLKGLKPSIFIFVFECDILNNKAEKNGLSIISVPDLRWKRRDIKTISLIAQCYAKQKALEAGADEAFMIENGKVTEGTSSSAFIIKDKTLITKALSNEILGGIRRKNILIFAKELNLKICQRAFSMNEVYEADEVFISAATFLLLPVVKADSRLINGGKIGEFVPKLRKKYKQKILDEIKTHSF
ncbi:aminotransferase class IV [Campylobacter sp. MIT 21-1685]|uniref:aminotransferase class IV n=1 Tax=unclassified Campylobacter TaxID=2593542 RepID=UPI00224B6C77|nr:MULTISPECIES: aminotransferase class IV [unclassified Campylobacter]MCX2682811.1 aminotransferase class IV [Campylobacter sp. MIT 21-1684]MCX2751043.1 aminotransferase class IV [Campylobacter sp. MIT 21-1682]MCX2807292.1 aminotransferase class IV [Campylobacter sp. MIT 21-1685]